MIIKPINGYVKPLLALYKTTNIHNINTEYIVRFILFIPEVIYSDLIEINVRLNNVLLEKYRRIYEKINISGYECFICFCM